MKLTNLQKALAEYMSMLSEEAYSAGWMKGLEHALWDAVISGPRKYGRISIQRKHINELRNRSAACGGWIIFDDNSEETWLPMDEWKNRYDSEAKDG